jgi:phosphate starvation-inducible PhoH-like protein
MPSTLIRRHSLDPPDNRRLAHLCGPLDAHLRAIESALGVTLSRRDASFRIEGARDAIERAAALLDTLYEAARDPISEPALQGALARAAAPALAAVIAPASAAGSAPEAAVPQAAAPIVLHTRHADLTGRTPNQMQYLAQMLTEDITFGIGPAGTGKTFLAVACAVDALERHGVQRIVLTRPAVEAGERLGFLPGDLAQKVDPYLRPLYDALYDLMGLDRVTRAFEKGLIEIAPLAFMRGRTLNHAFVILDEAQNTTREQMKMFLTRIGFGSRCVVNGDVSQIDLPKGMGSGLVDAAQVLAGVAGIGFTHFTAADVVRHPLVARIVEAYERSRGTEPGR